MLGKLTKFEFKATARTFLPLYIAVFAMTLLNKTFIYLQGNAIFGDYREGIIGKIIFIMSGFAMFAFVIAIMATVFYTIFVIVQRFYKNLFTDEGYLMHTLPVSENTHIGAKLITSTVWMLISIIVIFLAIFLLVINKESWLDIKWFFNEIPRIAEEFGMAMNVNFYTFATFIIVSALISLPVQILTFYLSIALGSVIIPKHRIVGAFVGYVLISTISQVVTSIAMGLGAFILSEDLVAMMNAPMPPENFFYFIFAFSMLFSIASGIVSYFVTSHILTKKLNLE